VSLKREEALQGLTGKGGENLRIRKRDLGGLLGHDHSSRFRPEWPGGARAKEEPDTNRKGGG